MRVLAERGEARPGQDARADVKCCVYVRVCMCVYNGCQEQPRKETREFGIKGNYCSLLCVGFRQAAGLFVSVCELVSCGQDV